MKSVADGTLGIDAALLEMRHLPFEDIGFANIDHHRDLRDALPEVILGEKKTPEQIAAIGAKLAERSDRLLVTRLSAEGFAALSAVLPDAVYHEAPRVAIVDRNPRPLLPGIMVLSGGTADLPVAEEAALTAGLMGHDVVRAFDVGVAGIHRLFDRLREISEANVIVAVAGMEGALPSVVSGLVSAPVIAVPTSVGYGANFGGLAPWSP